MAELTPVQQAAERALLVLLRKHMVHTYEVARRLTAKEIDERVLDLRRLKSAHPKGGSYFTATVNAMIRELLRLKIQPS